MPKVCFQMMVFNSDYVLAECLESVQRYGPIVAVEGPVRYWQNQGFKTSTDMTTPILQAYGIPTIHGQFEEKDEMARAGEALIPDGTEWVWVLDSDEIWRPEDIESILVGLDSNRVDSLAFKAWSFYGGFERYMTGFEEDFQVVRIQRWYPGAHWHTHRPPTVLAPDGQPWMNKRHLTHEATSRLGLRFFHYSYVWPSQMQMKAKYYHDRDPGGTIPNYFERVYLPWVLGDPFVKATIEGLYNGVHNWLPHRRGPCLTQYWRHLGIGHPAIIQKSMTRLEARFKDELASIGRPG